MYKELEQILPHDILYYNEPLKKHSTFRIGGPAQLLAVPENECQLKKLFSYIKEHHIPFIVLGNGSNVLFSDKGFAGIVIKLGTQYSGITQEEYGDLVLLRAKAGTLLSKLANYACEAGLEGLEFAAGIPGSVGGAILMNAGAYDGEIAQVLKESRCFDIDNMEIQSKSYEEHYFSYRHSSYEEDGKIILEGVFCLKRGNKAEILDKIKALNARRIEKQPLEFPSAGSTFKRPAGNFAGKLIEECGLKGFRIGGAMVSEKHCGFIINVGNATCNDVVGVIEYVRNTVLEKKGILLETEVKII